MTITHLATVDVRVLVPAQSANDRFKQNYPRYLRWALLMAILLTALGVWLMPRYEPVPYKPRAEEIQIINIYEAPVIEEKIKPREVPLPPRNIEPVDDEDPGGVDELPPWITDPWTPVPPANPNLTSDDGFVASSANPLLRLQPKADYPEIARKAGLEGTVLVNVLVGMDGMVDEAVVTHGVHPLLDKAARRAALRCVFEPARQRTLKVKAWVAVPYRFRLR
ncbi:MAG: energy transducer TonB [bacterium]|nr:energy transducer TonB [bacterium]